MPLIFAIALCIMILAGLAGLVRLEYKRARNGPRLSSSHFLNREDPKDKRDPRDRHRIAHEIGH